MEMIIDSTKIKTVLHQHLLTHEILQKNRFITVVRSCWVGVGAKDFYGLVLAT